MAQGFIYPHVTKKSFWGVGNVHLGLLYALYV
jgi:hypothetical protein